MFNAALNCPLFMWEPFIKYTFSRNLIQKQYDTMTDIIVYVFDDFVLYSLRFFLHLNKHLQRYCN